MRTTSLTLLTFVALFVVSAAYAQKQNNIWYFGHYAGLDFNSGAPVAIGNGALYNDEGSASVSDSSGKILFYTNGMTIWNKNHTIMANGTGLMGNNSSTQSAIIVQQPDSFFLYYVFSTFSGVYYSVVDMRLNGGLGGVVAGRKNIRLNTTAGEKICATAHANGKDIWVLTNDASNGFDAFRVSPAGIAPGVHSNTGATNSNNNLYGQMKFTIKGDKVAMGIADQSGPNKSVFVGNFDNTTGIVSNGYNMVTPLNQTYGLEFSPNGRYLYGAINYSITQYDLDAGSPAAVQASAITIGTSSGYPCNGLQIGPDKKIYVAMGGGTRLSVINAPDTRGTACNFVADALALFNGTSSGLGLPSLVNYYWMQGAVPQLQVSHIQADPVCHDSCTGTATINVLQGQGPFRIQWLASGDTTATVNNLCPGKYIVSVTDNLGTRVNDTVTIGSAPLISVSISAPVTAICASDSVLLTATPGFQNYNWNIPGSGESIQVKQAGNYFVLATDSAGCRVKSNQVTVTVNPLPQATITTSNDVICSSDSAQVCVSGATFAGYQWNTGETTACITVKAAGNYYVSVTDANACIGQSNRLPIAVHPVSSVSIIVRGDTLSSFGASAYQWIFEGQPMPGATGQVHVAAASGNYAVQITDNNGCIALSNPVFVEKGGTGIQAISAKPVRVYPNPLTNGYWQVGVEDELVGSTIQVCDASGRIIFKEIIRQAVSPIEVEVATGIYMLYIIGGNDILAVKKLVKTQ